MAKKQDVNPSADTVEEVDTPFPWEDEEIDVDNNDDTEKDEPKEDDPKDKKDDPVDEPDDKTDDGDDDNTVDEPDDTNTDDNDGSDDDEPDEGVVTTLFDSLAEKMGLEFDDDFEAPKSADDLINTLAEIVEKSSEPEYADDRVRQLDEYLKNGGDFEKFYKVQKEAISYDNINLEDEGNQRRVLSDYLELEGYDDNQIARKIKKYEDTGILQDEAEDALARIKKAKEKETEAMLKQQERERREYEESQRTIFENALNTIKSSDNIRGIKLSQKDKKELVDYMFKIQPNGKTKWQEEYGKSINNMIESAFFTMRGDALVQSIKKSGETSAAMKFKKALASNKVKGTKPSAKTGSIDDFVSAFGF